MTQPRPRLKFTYQDYRTAPEDRRYELHDGDLLLVPSPVTYHQRILLRLTRILDRFVQSQGIGEVFIAPYDVVLSDYDVVQPDILFVSNERAHIVTPENIRGGPDLVVEVLSPSTAERDLGYKRTLYARHGVGEYWIVDPGARTVEVLKLEGEEYVRHRLFGQEDDLLSPAMPGLPIQLREVF